MSVHFNKPEQVSFSDYIKKERGRVKLPPCSPNPAYIPAHHGKRCSLDKAAQHEIVRSVFQDIYIEDEYA
jgi:hypothetical protein